MKKLILLSFFITCFVANVFPQDIPFFEVADNEALGLTPVLLDRWGCSSADIDRNGWPDIYNNKWRGRLESQIYMNDGGYFTDIYGNSPELSAAEMEGNATRTPVLVDFDNDGDRDLMFGTDYNLFMFRNDDNVFVNVTEDLGIESGSPGFVSIYGYEMSAWIDWDLDGDLDALVAQTNNPDYILYRNDGDQFVDIAGEVGLEGMNELGDRGDRGFDTGRIQWIDWDGDGDPDLSAGWKLFRNDDGYLNEVSESVGFTPFKEIRFCDWFDYDLDGDFDFFLQGYSNHDELWRNEGGTFVDATQDVGLDLFTDDGQATLNIGDLDNDGDEDLFFSINDWEDIEALLINYEEDGVRSLIEVASYAGFGIVGDRKGAAILDYDMDGLLDIFCPSLQYGSIVYHNLGPEAQNNWIGLDLWGTESNKDGVGSLVECYAGGNKYVRYKVTPSTWKVQDNPYIHFGIGQATSIDSVVIHWSRGIKQVLINPEINQYHKVEESAGTSVQVKNNSTPQTLNLAQNYPNPFNPETKITYELPENSNVLLEVYNLAGQKVATLVNAQQHAGRQEVIWNGKDFSGIDMPSGVYLYRLHVNDHILTKKMMLVR
nr:T9SS type A sorting domain-containing protein [candidate division KSB1 bacterium]